MPGTLIAQERILATRPTVYCPFGEGSSPVRDLGHNRSRTVSGTPEYRQPGPHGRPAIGTNSSDTNWYVDIGTLSPGIPNPAKLAGGAWIRPKNFAPSIFDTIMSNATPTWWGFAFYVGSGSVNRFSIDVADGGGFPSALHSPSNLLVAGAWQHVAFSISGTGGALFLNGKQVASGTVPSQPWGTGGLLISQFHSSYGRVFRGRLADVLFYSREVHTDEWDMIYQASRARFERGLIGRR